ncbi:F-box/kelch-repeat protein At3g06240 [Linum grandiflorum]
MTGGKNSNLFLPEDLTTDILERLPTVSAAIRLRSVSKSWQSLLSDHKFIFRNPNVEDQLKILITGFGENYQNTIDYVDKLHYSLRSYETLHEETRGKTPLVHWTPTWENYVFLSCCDGIFCLSGTTEEIVSEILLWNPATSESISLPPYPFPIPRNPQQNLLLCHEIIGFGFDPQTNDYKVVHKIEFFDDVEDHDAIVHAEVYSLTNGSWKILSDDKTFDDWLDDYEDLQYVHQQREVSRNDKCYWFHSYPYRVCGIIIFDMSKEVFAHIKFSPPPLFRDKEMRHEWNYGSCFMLKGTLIENNDANSVTAEESVKRTLINILLRISFPSEQKATMTGGGNNSLFLPEDLTTDILVRLPTVSAAIRLRSVSKSWQSLLSDHKFIFRNPTVDEQLKILITGFGENYENTIDKIHYSLRSYETLHEETRGETPLVHRTPTWGNYVFAGCCDGIFCLSRTSEEIVSKILLWNPATSESVSLPPFPFPIRRNPQQNLLLCQEIIGFGFDPQTNDYKVVHKIEFFDDVADHDPRPIFHAEVYSLINGSWKTMLDDKTFDDWLGDYEDLYYVHQQREVARNDKCYWFHGNIPGVCGIFIFDVSEEVFDHIEFSPPPVFEYEEISHAWNCRSCFMLKGTLIVSFGHITWRDGEDTAHYAQETWGMLEFGAAESWTKLLVLEQFGRNFKFLEVWKDGAYICSDFEPKNANQDDAIFVFNPTIEETKLDVRGLKVEGTIPPFGAHVFTPTQVSLSRQVN